MSKKAMLIVMDGWGLGTVPLSDAILQAETPFVDSLYKKYPHTTLTTFGKAVGLPEGQVGNSEVGHLNLGAGRVVYQELERINVAIQSGELAHNPDFLQTIDYAITHQKPLHIMGLVSNGGVHSHSDHLKAILDLCQQNKLTNVFIHCFTDGRDTDPKSGLAFIKELEEHTKKSVGTIASVSGRYYAMDRDKRWERIALAYQALVQGQGQKALTAQEAIEQSYHKNITDEFILPTVITTAQGQPLATIQNGDAVLCFNFRTDRCREMTEVLTQKDYPDFGMKKMSLHYTTLTRYDDSFKNVTPIFLTDDLKNTLGEVLETAHKTQLRIAETEKYPHVTFFFSGGREKEFKGEARILEPSPKVATYDLQPTMSAQLLTQKLIDVLNQTPPDFVCLNFANTDMVGHTGVFKAAMVAAQTVNHCVQQVVELALQKDYIIFLTADHGNSDYMINEDGSPNTAHTKNLVPLFVIDKTWRGSLKQGKLGDIAPSILSAMGLPIPKEMTGNNLLTNE